MRGFHVRLRSMLCKTPIQCTDLVKNNLVAPSQNPTGFNWSVYSTHGYGFGKEYQQNLEVKT